MEYYVKKMPKNCSECEYGQPCKDEDGDDLCVIETCLNADGYENNCVSEYCHLKSLDQHDAEVRAEERKKVLAELKTNYGGIEKDIITEKYHLTNFDCDITKPIKQIIKEERKKVVAELQEWNDKLIDEGYIIDYEDLEQKLNELKEIK